MDTFKNKEYLKDAKMLIEIKKKDMHEARMETKSNDYFRIEKEDYDMVFQRFETKKKKSYNLLTIISKSFQNLS